MAITGTARRGPRGRRCCRSRFHPVPRARDRGHLPFASILLGLKAAVRNQHHLARCAMEQLMTALSSKWALELGGSSSGNFMASTAA